MCALLTRSTFFSTAFRSISISITLSLYYSGPNHSSVSFSIEQTIFAIQSAKTKYFHIVCVCVDASAICHFGSLSTF